MKLGLVVYENLNLLAVSIEGVTCSCIYSSNVLLKGNLRSCSSFHVSSTLHECLDVEARDSDGQQTYRSEYRETTTYIIGDDEALVTLVVGSCACSTSLSICNSNDYFASHLDATLVLTLLLEQAESESGLCGCTRLRDVDNTKLFVLEELGEFEEVVFADIVTCIDDSRAVPLEVAVEVVAQCLNHCTCAKVAATDTSNYYHVTVCTESFCCSLDVVEVFLGDA